MTKFHFSIDDVLLSLIEVTDSGRPLREHPFFKELWSIHEMFNVRIGLHVFNSIKINDDVRHLSEVRNLQSELIGGWLYFGPHAVNDDTPPYSQSLYDQRQTFESIFHELQRIAGPYVCNSIRLHHYSECYELADYFLERGVRELFVTDKPVGSHRLDDMHKRMILESGSTSIDNLKLSRTHLRVENLANENVTKDEFLERVNRILDNHGRLVIYSHEYEHKRSEVVKMLHDVMSWLCLDLGLMSEIP